MVPESKNASFTAVVTRLYMVDTSAGAVTATLPSGSSNGQIRFVDAEQTWATYNLTITPASGEKLAGLSINESLICDVSGSWVELVWDDENNWWTVTSNGAVNAAAVEYAATSGTWTADDSTTVFGSSGQAMGGALSGGAVAKTITWSSDVRSTDEIVVEASKDRVHWVPINGAQIGPGNSTVIPCVNSAGTSVSGVGYRPGAAANQTIVQFGAFLNMANDDSPTTDWPSSNAYWRVRKTSGRSVSYPEVVPGVTAGLVAAQGLKGRTDGSAIATGYVGEEIEQAPAASVNSAGSGTSFNITSKSFEAGVYLVWGQGNMLVNGATGITAASISVSQTSGSNNAAHVSSIASSLTTTTNINLAPKVYRFTSTTTLYLVGQINSSAGTPQFGTSSYIRGVRIA